MDVFFAIVIASVAAFGFLVLLLVFRYFLLICRPNEVLVLSGSTTRAEDGSSVGYRVVFGGWKLRGLFERADRMSLQAIPIDLRVTNAYSRGGIPLTVHAIANVKITSDPRQVMNAIERFMGRDESEIHRVAKESLEGHLRGVLARLTPEEVNEDRLKFAGALVDEADDDLRKLGLQLDTLKVLNVADDVKYLDSIGRERIANVLMVADIAESQARSQAEQAQASAHRSAQVAVEEAEARVLQKQNELRRMKAEFEARAKSEENRTVQMAAEARASAEQELQELRKQLEQTRLLADMVLPAQAAQRAEALRARGAAAAIAENGAAMTEVLNMLTRSWSEAGPDARDIFLIQQVEQVLTAVAQRVKDVEVGEVNLVDRGDGRALAAFLAGYPAMVNQVLAEVSRGTGIDVPALLNPNRENA